MPNPHLPNVHSNNPHRTKISARKSGGKILVPDVDTKNLTQQSKTKPTQQSQNEAKKILENFMSNQAHGYDMVDPFQHAVDLTGTKEMSTQRCLDHLRRTQFGNQST